MKDRASKKGLSYNDVNYILLKKYISAIMQYIHCITFFCVLYYPYRGGVDIEEQKNDNCSDRERNDTARFSKYCRSN